MALHGVISGLICGLAAVVVGAIPGLFEDFTDGVRTAGESFLYRVPVRPRGRWQAAPRHRHWGLITFGAAVMLLSIMAYLLR